MQQIDRPVKPFKNTFSGLLANEGNVKNSQCCRNFSDSPLGFPKLVSILSCRNLPKFCVNSHKGMTKVAMEVDECEPDTDLDGNKD